MYSIIAQRLSVTLLLMVRLFSGLNCVILLLKDQPLDIHRKKLAATEPKLVTSLIHLMDSENPKVRCQAALALRNLASDGK